MLELIFELLQAGGLLILFILLVLEGNPILGSFIPGTVIVVFYGFFMSTQNEYSILLVLIVITLGSIVGDFLGYLMGKKLGIKGVERFGLKKESGLYNASCGFFNKFGVFSIILGRQFNLTRAFIPFFAGLSGMKYYTFVFFATISGILWALITFMLGYYFGYVALARFEFLFSFILFMLIYIWVLYSIYRFFKTFYSHHIVIIRRYAFLNIFAMLVLFFLFVLFLGFKEIGLGLLLNTNLSFLYFDFPLSEFLFSKLFILLFFEALFLAPLFLKKVRLFVIFLWSLFLYLQYIFFSILIAKRFFQIELSFTFFMLTLGFFYLLVLIYDSPKLSFKLRNYLVLFIMSLLVILMILYASHLGGDFYKVILTFLSAAIGCELLYVLSHYKILDSYLCNSIKKA